MTATPLDRVWLRYWVQFYPESILARREAEAEQRVKREALVAARELERAWADPNIYADRWQLMAREWLAGLPAEDRGRAIEIASAATRSRQVKSLWGQLWV